MKKLALLLVTSACLCVVSPVAAGDDKVLDIPNPPPVVAAQFVQNCISSFPEMTDQGVAYCFCKIDIFQSKQRGTLKSERDVCHNYAKKAAVRMRMIDQSLPQERVDRDMLKIAASSPFCEADSFVCSGHSWYVFTMGFEQHPFSLPDLGEDNFRLAMIVSCNMDVRLVTGKTDNYDMCKERYTDYLKKSLERLKIWSNMDLSEDPF